MTQNIPALGEPRVENCGKNVLINLQDSDPQMYSGTKRQIASLTTYYRVGGLNMARQGYQHNSTYLPQVTERLGNNAWGTIIWCR